MKTLKVKKMNEELPKKIEELSELIANLSWDRNCGFTEESYLPFGYAVLDIVLITTKDTPIQIYKIVDDPNGKFKLEGSAIPASVVAGSGYYNMDFRHFAIPELVYAVGSVLLFPDMNFREDRYRRTPKHGEIILSNSLNMLETYPNAMEKLADKSIEVSELQIPNRVKKKMGFPYGMFPHFDLSSEEFEKGYQSLLKSFGETIKERLGRFNLLGTW